MSSAVVPQLCPARIEKKKLILCAQKLPAKVLATMVMPRLGSDSLTLCCSSKRHWTVQALSYSTNLNQDCSDSPGDKNLCNL